MKVWIDLANSPHVPLLEPIVAALHARGDEVVVTVRDHAQTLPLAERAFSTTKLVGGASPPGRLGKALTIAGRAAGLRSFARRTRPDVALSHGSYAQIVAARSAGVPAVTMMDYEHQPANHLSFRLATRVIVPELFPRKELRRFGGRPSKVVRFSGFKEELYLAGFEPHFGLVDELGLDTGRVMAVFRPPPEGALYHRMANLRFDSVLAQACEHENVQVVLLPRTAEQRTRYEGHILVPERPVDGSSLLALADLTVGGGGTMNRESALLGTPTYTVFAGRLAAVDAELVKAGLLYDLRDPGTEPSFVKKSHVHKVIPPSRQDAIAAIILAALDVVTRSPRRSNVRTKPS